MSWFFAVSSFAGWMPEEKGRNGAILNTSLVWPPPPCCQAGVILQKQVKMKRQEAKSKVLQGGPTVEPMAEANEGQVRTGHLDASGPVNVDCFIRALLQILWETSWWLLHLSQSPALTVIQNAMDCGLNSRWSFLTVLEAQKSKIKCPSTTAPSYTSWMPSGHAFTWVFLSSSEGTERDMSAVPSSSCKTNSPPLLETHPRDLT